MEEVFGKTCAVFRRYIFSLHLAQKSHGWLTSCLASQGILSSSPCIFGHKQERKEDSVGGNQGDFGTL